MSTLTDFQKVALGLVTLAREQPGKPMHHHFIDRTYNGLKAVVKLDGEMWQLGLWRIGRYLDTPEIDAARAAFGAPKGAVAIPKTYKDDKGETWKGVILSWHQPVIAPAAMTAKEFIAQ